MKRLGQIIALSTELGITMGLASAGLVIVGLLAGRSLDELLGTGRVATIGLTILGAVAGQLVIYRLAVQSARRFSAPGADAANRAKTLSRLGLALRALALLTLPALVGLALGLALRVALGIQAIWALLFTLGGFLLGVAGVLHLVRTRGIRFEGSHVEKT